MITPEMIEHWPGNDAMSVIEVAKARWTAVSGMGLTGLMILGSVAAILTKVVAVISESRRLSPSRAK